MVPVLQSHLPFAPWMDPSTRRLPGVLPLTDDAWLCVDEAFAGQMAERDRLIAETPTTVYAALPEARMAADELYATVLAGVPGYSVTPSHVTRPDGVTVPLDPAHPLLTLGRLVQEDLCLLQADGDEHVLTGAILCFPASWTLAQKIGRPLSVIHHPVAPYDDRIRTSVQRMFHAIRPEAPLWRGNVLLYDDATLHQPRTEGARRPRPVANTYLRSERQCLLRLPQTRAVVFTIHTYVLRTDQLDPVARDSLMDFIAASHTPPSP
jgi:dimethylamine monooxygenase subunit A